MTTATECAVCEEVLVAEIGMVMADEVSYTKIVAVFEIPTYPDAAVHEVFCPECGIVYRYQPET
jgi:hypothetical protein